MVIKTLNEFVVPRVPDTICTYPRFSSWPLSIKHNRYCLETRKPDFLGFRDELISSAFDYTTRLTGKSYPSSPMGTTIIATGHQPCWHHCGIFIKSLAGSLLASRLGGLFIHVVLDHDIVNTDIQLPSQAPSGLLNLPLENSFNPKRNMPTERIRNEAMMIKNFMSQCVDCSANNSLLNNAWNTNCLNDSFEKPLAVSDHIIYLLDLLYLQLKTQIIYLPVSRISRTKAFQNFCIDIISQFSSFACDYNNAISSSNNFTGIPRLQQKIIHNLLFVELPFWLITQKNKRETLWASSNHDNSIIIASEKEILFMIENSSIRSLFVQIIKNNYAIRPKAILLTCFLRLYLCDWFIHGVGGARYESISDHLMKHFWGIEGLSYGTASLTSYLFEEERIAAESTLDDLSQKLRLYKCKPETLKNAALLMNTNISSLIQDKLNMVARSRDVSLPSGERENAWKKTKDINLEIQSLLPYSETSLRNDIEVALKRLSIYQKRDFFFGLFPKKYLISLSEVINAHLQ